MLRGSIEYNGHRYNVKGVDSSTTMRLRLETSNFDSIKIMGGDGCDEDDLLWNRTFEVKQGKVSVETKVSRDANNKKVKAPINNDMFCKLGASIQYIKSHCYIKNSVGIVGIQLASGDFEPEAVREYEIKMGYDVAEVSLRFGVVTKLKYDTDNIKISLEEDFYDDEILYAVKDGVQKGFLFKEEYLGFSPESDIKNFESDFVDDELLCKDLEEVIRLHPEKSFSWLRGKDYRIVTDDTLEEVCDYILNFDDYVYFDTETTGLNINFMSRTGGADQCVGIILSVKDGESFFFPMQMKYIKNLCDGDHAYFMTRYMKEILETKRLVCHNAPFDWKVAYIYDINANIVDDTMAILLVTIANEHRDMSVALKYQASVVLHRDSLELSDLVKNGDWGESDVKFWDLTEELTRYYACADTDNTRGLHRWELNNDLLGKYGARKIYEIELAFGFAVAYQEFYGHRVDIDNVDALSEEIHRGIKESKEKMVAMLGHDFNPNSSPQLINIMYNELGMPEKRSRKTGNLTSDKDTLKYFAEITDIEGNIKYPFVKELLHFRELEGVRKLIDKFPETMSLDGYIFSSVRQYGTTTGRVSVSDTNYQSYNDPVKKNIVPRPGFWMFDTDYSSIEYRVLGNMSGNEMIKKSFYDPDFDYHTYQASRMYGVPYANVSSKLRKAAKGINFGLPYGMGDESLGIRIFGEKSDLNTRKAEQLRKKYFVGQEDIQDFFDTARNRGANEGYTETYFGRRRYYDKTKFTINAIRRQAGNQVIQGCIQLHTRILTQEYGIVEVGDHIGETLSVWDGNDWTQGTIVNSGKKRKCIVTFNGKHKIICSPNHKFMVLTRRGGKMWVRAEELHSRMEYRNPHRVAVNSEKRENGLSLVCEKDEVTSELCVVVESVEITDEYIDMCDVCNTERGYFVADGIITHNSSADIYKLAVGRVFKRICKEGWLGKVLLDGFIHDELLGEVSCDIDPMVFLKVLREEFEVKITNQDGSPWCPLYMGFGWGMSWYQAKKTEVPIKLQWEFVEKYGETGYPLWDGDGKKFCDSIPELIADFEIRDCSAQLLDPENQGKEIKPALNSSIIEMVRSNKEKVEDEDLREKISAKNVDTQDAIDAFCMIYRVDRSKVNILSIPEIDESSSQALAIDNTDMFDDEDDVASALENAIAQRIEMLGMYVNTREKWVKMLLVPDNYMQFIKKRTVPEGSGGYKVMFRDINKKVDYETKVELMSSEIPLIQSMYINLLKGVLR